MALSLIGVFLDMELRTEFFPPKLRTVRISPYGTLSIVTLFVHCPFPSRVHYASNADLSPLRHAGPGGSTAGCPASPSSDSASRESESGENLDTGTDQKTGNSG